MKIPIILLFLLAFIVPAATAAVSVSLTDAPAPSYPGQQVTFIATVIDGSQPVTDGNVRFYKEQSGYWQFLSSSDLNVSGKAEYQITYYDTGMYRINATFFRDGSSYSDDIYHYVNKIPVTVNVTSEMNPSYSLQGTTYTATITPLYQYYFDGGTVQFKADGSNMGQDVPVSGRSAILKPGHYSPLDLGTHTITAEYSGTDELKPATSPGYTQQIIKIPTETHLALWQTSNPSEYGSRIRFAAYSTSTIGYTPYAGTMYLERKTSSGWTTELDQGGSDVLFTVTDGPYSITHQPGTYTFRAKWSGNDDFLGNTSEELEHTVNKMATWTSVTSSNNPSFIGEPVSFNATVSGNGEWVSSGTVQFFIDGTSFGSPVSVDANGRVTSGTTSSLAIGTHTVAAEYSGTSDKYANSSDLLYDGQEVLKFPSQTTLTTNRTHTVYGEPVRFDATVTASPGNAVPSGTVTFTAGAVTLGQGTLTGSAPYTATLTTSGLPVGPNQIITATYPGDEDVASSSSTISQTVNKAGTSTAAYTNNTPSTYGQDVKFTALVAVTPPGAGMPAGTVIFKEGAMLIATGTMNSTAGTSSTLPTLAAGTHTISANYTGNANFTTSGQVFTQVVNKAATTMILATNKTPTVFGEPVRFTATTTVNAPGDGTPTGTVTFFDGSMVLATKDLDGSGVTTLDLSTLPAGLHTINATYSGDENFTAGYNSTSQVVNKAITSTATVTNKTPAVFGEPVRFTATTTVNAPGAGIPTGNITFTDGSTVLMTKNLDGSGVTTLDTASLAVGTHTINATYSGDTRFTSSTGPGITQVVQKAPTTTRLSSSKNPSVYSQSAATFTATVAVIAPGAGTPTGSVTFKDGTTTLGIATLSSGIASYIPLNTALSSGSHPITAVYEGDARYRTSTSAVLTQVVNPPPKITAFVPNTGKRGAAALKFVISGSAFQNGATVSLTRTGAPSIQATGVIVAPAKNSITCTIAIPAGALTGTRSVVIKNPDDGTIIATGFTVK